MDKNSRRSPRWTRRKRKPPRSLTERYREPPLNSNWNLGGRSRTWKSAGPRWSGRADSQRNPQLEEVLYVDSKTGARAPLYLHRIVPGAASDQPGRIAPYAGRYLPEHQH